MDDVHTTHRTAGIVEDPLLGDIVLGVDVLGVLLVQLGDDVVHNRGGITRVGVDAALGELMEVLLVEDIELLQVLLEKVDNRAEDTDQDAEEGQNPREAATGLLTLLLLLPSLRFGLVGRHDGGI